MTGAFDMKTVTSGWKRCWETHPLLPIITKDGTHYISGGSCNVIPDKGVEVFIGFDSGMKQTFRQFPWIEGEHIHFHIVDMKAPSNAKHFENLVKWTALQLIAGKQVHAGCIGGHGRTGTFFSALVTHMTGEVDSISYVRKNYCKKVVESKAQIDFLYKEWGIKKVQPTKGAYSGVKKQTSTQTYTIQTKLIKHQPKLTGKDIKVSPVLVTGQLHGDNKILTNQ
jgi:hypothetical protein